MPAFGFLPLDHNEQEQGFQPGLLTLLSIFFRSERQSEAISQHFKFRERWANSKSKIILETEMKQH